MKSDCEASELSMLEHRLTDHLYGREIAELPEEQINRLRRMLLSAVEQRIHLRRFTTRSRAALRVSLRPHSHMI